MGPLLRGVKMLLQMGPLLHLGPVITLVPSKHCLRLTFAMREYKKKRLKFDCLKILLQKKFLNAKTLLSQKNRTPNKMLLALLVPLV